MEAIFILKITGMFLFLLLIVLIPVFLGQRYGLYHKSISSDPENAPVGTVVAAAFGTLAFFLAFIFQITANRYMERKELLLTEVTNIRTTYLRAGLLQEPIRSDTRKLLVEYTDLRVEMGRDTAKLTHAIARSQEILDTLWSYTEKLAEMDRSSEVYSLFTTSINDLVDNYNQRITVTLEYRIPPFILLILIIVAIFSMFSQGYHFGISGKGNLKINIVLAFIFAMMMFLIISLDRPEIGLAKLNQKPMVTLQRQLHVMQSKENNIHPPNPEK
jgi:ABC-type multidrug transport system fused ATPase/permease subunit